MSLNTTLLFDLYEEHVTNGGDARTKGWFLVDSPIVPAYITLAYYIFVTQIGPRFMKDRQPFAIKPLILFYNAVQIFLNIWILYNIGIRMPFNENYFCMEIFTEDEHRNMSMPYYGWIYYMMKYLDMLDTIFFVFTKKQKLISTLHLFHHTSMIFATWIGLKYFPSGVLAIAPYLNTWVHAIMYSYYFCVAYYGKIGLQWKQMMTSIQLLQFFVGTSIFIVNMLNPWCNFPKWILIPTVAHGFTFISMFGQFYYKNYIVVNAKAKKSN